MIRIAVYTVLNMVLSFGIMGLLFKMAGGHLNAYLVKFPAVFFLWFAVTVGWVLLASFMKLTGNALIIIPFALLFIYLFIVAGSVMTYGFGFLGDLVFFTIQFTWSQMVLKAIQK